jgi:hypothetical protein
MGVPQNGWFIIIVENTVKMDDLGVVPVWGTPENGKILGQTDGDQKNSAIFQLCPQPGYRIPISGGVTSYHEKYL